MLEIKNLHARVEDKEILKGVDLTRERRRGARDHGAERLGQEHARAACSPAATPTRSPAARSLFKGKDLLDLDPEERAREGVFLAFQYPVEIPGVSNSYFLKAALNAIRKHRGEPELDAMEFLTLVQGEDEAARDGPDASCNRSVNEGFSGGEKKRNEIFQMAVLEPKLRDPRRDRLRPRHRRAARSSPNGVNALRSPERAIIVVTHYQRLLNYIVPDFVHVLSEGRIVKIGRQGAGARARGEGLRLDRGPTARQPCTLEPQR